MKESVTIEVGTITAEETTGSITTEVVVVINKRKKMRLINSSHLKMTSKQCRVKMRNR